jgi:hypothetical protein
MVAKAGDGIDGQSAKGQGVGWRYRVHRVPGSGIINIGRSSNLERPLRNFHTAPPSATMIGKWACCRARESLALSRATFSSRCRHIGGAVVAVARRAGEFIKQNPAVKRDSSHLGTAGERILNWARFRSVSRAGGSRMAGRIRGGIATFLGRMVPRKVHRS